MPPIYATRPEDLIPRDRLLTMTGLEALEAMLDGVFSGPPIARLMNFELASAERGRVTFTGTPLFDHLNPMGTVHGGWYGAILDSAMGCAAMSVVPQGHWYTTLEYKINLARALAPGMAAIAEATVQHGGRSTVVAEARLTGADGRLYATGSTTCIILAG